MNLETFREYCLSKKGAEEDFTFGVNVMVFKVMGKMFASTGIDRHPPSANLKCDPALAIELREQYNAVQPGYHMNKKHWNTVIFDGDVGNDKLKELIDHSYGLVINSLGKNDKARLL